MLPISVSLFSISILISAVSNFIGVMLQRKVCSRDVVSFMLVVIVCCFFLCMNIGRMLHGGIHLIYERESDAIELQGIIEEIEELDRFSFPELKTEYGYNETNGVKVLINGVECIAVTKGTLDIGDNVIVTFLPQSRYILSIRGQGDGS